jgi:hypothetical protein
VTVAAGSCEIIPDEPEDGERQKLMATVLSPPERRDKFPLFAKVGVPEVWRFDGSRLVIYGLAGGEYFERDASIAFLAVTASNITAFLKDSETMDRPEWTRKLRGWARGLR